MLGLVTAAAFGMMLAVVVRAAHPILLGPLGAGIGWCRDGDETRLC